jgi:hypothetical protein
VVAPFTSRLIHEWASVRLRCELVSVQHQQQQPAASVAAMARLEEEAAALLGTR